MSSNLRPPDTLGAYRLRRAIATRGQVAVARLLGKSQQTVSRYALAQAVPIEWSLAKPLKKIGIRLTDFSRASPNDNRPAVKAPRSSPGQSRAA
jgi:hypothetical protein